MKRYSSILITLGFLALFIGYGLLHREIFTSLTQVALWSIAAVTVGKLINVWTTGIFTKWTVEAFTDRLSGSESFMIAILTAIGNFFGPLFGGLGIRAVYLKKYHRLPYSKFTSTLIGYYQMMFLANNLLAIVSILWLARTPQSGFVLAFFAVWLVVFVGLAFLRMPPRERLEQFAKHRVAGFVLKALYDIEAGWRLMLGNRKLLLQMATLAIVNLAALYATNYVEFVALGIHTTPAAMGLYTAIVQASLLLSITPGAIGVREAILLVLAGSIGIDSQQIIQVAILDRGVYFVLLAVLALATRHSSLRRSFAAGSEAGHSDQ